MSAEQVSDLYNNISPTVVCCVDVVNLSNQFNMRQLMTMGLCLWNHHQILHYVDITKWTGEMTYLC